LLYLVILLTTRIRLISSIKRSSFDQLSTGVDRNLH
jgi:hypothetical protein